MIVITGATGALNGATVEHLLGRIPATDITVVARDISKADGFAQRGIAVRYGDYTDPDSLPRAFEGADRLLLVSAPDPSADVVAMHRNAIRAATVADVGRIVYTSHQGASLDTPFKSGRDHAATEQLLAESGIAWTSLRNGFYSHYLPWLLGPWRETGEIRVPAEGAVSWTDRGDAAEAAAAILASDRSPDGPVTLTATAAPTFADIATMASKASGIVVSRSVVSPDAWVQSLTESGTPEYMANFLLGVFQAAERGDLSGVDPLLAQVLGREPHTVGELIGESVAASAA